jgi:hypothetical protein
LLRGMTRPGWPGWVSGWLVLFLGSAVVGLYGLVLLTGTVLRPGQPMPTDMLAFLSAARLAAQGQAASAYDWASFQMVQAEVLGTGPQAIGGLLGWLNPPHFFFAVLPLAPLGYGWAWLVWVLATAALLAAACWSVLPRAPAVVAVLAAPATLLTASVGQNGMLVAALFAWIFALLDRRPVLAGVALGLLTVKPQFGLLMPLLLVLTGRWRAFGAAAAVAVGAMVLSGSLSGRRPGWPSCPRWAAMRTGCWAAACRRASSPPMPLSRASGLAQPWRWRFTPWSR